MNAMANPGLPQDEGEIDAFLEAFESGTLPGSAFTHAAHIFTGACYVHALGEVVAIATMRDRIRAFNVAAGGQNTATSGYHETITVFWVKVLAQLHGECAGLGRAEFARHAVATFLARRTIYQEFYDFDLVGSEEARRVWIPPNVRSLP